MAMTPYQETVEHVAEALGTDPIRGLRQADAEARLVRDGPNRLTADAAEPWWRRFLAQFQDVLVVLLLIATAISAGLWVYERDAAASWSARSAGR